MYPYNFVKITKSKKVFIKFRRAYHTRLIQSHLGGKIMSNRIQYVWLLWLISALFFESDENSLERENTISYMKKPWKRENRIAFMVRGVVNWQMDDRVQNYVMKSIKHDLNLNHVMSEGDRFWYKVEILGLNLDSF